MQTPKISCDAFSRDPFFNRYKTKPSTERKPLAHSFNHSLSKPKQANIRNPLLFHFAHRNIIPRRISHMEQSVSEFQKYLLGVRSNQMDKMPQQIPHSTTSSFAIQKISKNSSVEKSRYRKMPLVNHRHSTTTPLFIFSRNPNSGIINAKSSMGVKIEQFRKNSTSSRFYRINRGDNTTIAPINIKRPTIVAENERLVLRRLTVKKPEYSQTDFSKHTLKPIFINCNNHLEELFA